LDKYFSKFFKNDLKRSKLSSTINQKYVTLQSVCSLRFYAKNHLTYQLRLAIHILEFQIKMDLKKYFLTGIAMVVPLAATVYILMSPSGGLTAQVSPSPMQS
jgi:hypothetical protein